MTGVQTCALPISIKIDGKFVYTPKPFSQACEEADKYILNLFEKTEATEYIAFIKGSSRSRKEINSSYKSNRVFEKPENYDEFVNYLIEKWKFIAVTDAETDDYVASYAYRFPDSITVSPDKDINNLAGRHYNPRKNEIIETSISYERFAFWSDMISGQSGDGISGLKGKGPKFAEKILKVADEAMEPYSVTVFANYIEHYRNTTTAIEEYYKNYMCLKIRKDLPITHEFIEIKYEQISQHTESTQDRTDTGF